MEQAAPNTALSLAPFSRWTLRDKAAQRRLTLLERNTMDIYGPEFEFAGEPVGLFENGISPDSEGFFRYEPYRGKGHLRMQEQLRKSGSAPCSYVHAGKKVSFVVIGCPESGVLNLSSFSVVSG